MKIYKFHGASRNIGNTRKTALYDCWKQTTIARILKNQVYIGNLEQGKRKKLNYKSKIRVSTPKEEHIVCENTHEPIIDKDIFYRAQNIIGKNSSFKGTKHDYLFKGLLYCADCGAKLYTTYSNYAYKKYGEYRYTTICYTYSKLYNKCTRHSNSIPVLENLLIKNIKSICEKYLNKDLEEQLVSLAQKEKYNSLKKKDIQTRLHETESNIKSNMDCIKNLYLDRVKNIIREDEFKNLIKEFESENERLKKQKKNFEDKLGMLNIDKENENGKLQKLAKEFISLEKPTKELLNQLIDKITITEDNIVTIYFKFSELMDINSTETETNFECKTINKRNKKAS